MDFSKSSNNNSINNSINSSTSNSSNSSNNLFNLSEEVNIDDNIYKSIVFPNIDSEDLVPPPLIRRLNMELENRD
jgi:hypothetical protein